MKNGYDLTPGLVGRLWAVSPQTVRRWADLGLLPYHRLPGGHRRFRREDLEAFAARHGLPAPFTREEAGRDE